MSLFGLAGLIIGGAGRLGAPIIKSVFEYYREKQEIEKLRIQSQIPQNICNKQCQCKFEVGSLYVKNRIDTIEKKEPKRFLFIIIIFFLAVCGASAELIFQLHYNALANFYSSLEVLRNTSYEIIGFIIAWILTGELGIDKVNPRK